MFEIHQLAPSGSLDRSSSSSLDAAIDAKRSQTLAD
jgi:hypothetical protein